MKKLSNTEVKLKKCVASMSIFFLDCNKMRFTFTYFNCLQAVRVQVMIQLTKIFWSRKDEIFHSFWF